MKYIQLSPFKPFAGWSIADRAPELAPAAAGWTGRIYVDGYELQISKTTIVELPSGIKDISALPPDIWVKYKAKRLAAGGYQALSVSFIPNEITDEEQRFNAKDTGFKVWLSPTSGLKNGVIVYKRLKFKALNDQDSVDYVTRVLESLIPAWQKSLPDEDPRRMHFHVYIVQSNPLLTQTLSDGAGNILVSTNMLARLQNEAQLATMLSSDVSSALLRVQYRYLATRRTEEVLGWSTLGVGLFVPFVGLTPLITGSVYQANVWTPLVEQGYRIGMRYIADAGYDIRQAPEALRRVDDKHAEKKEAKGEIVTGTAEHLEQIYATEYANEEWSGKRIGQQEYEAFLNRVKAEDPKLKK